MKWASGFVGLCALAVPAWWIVLYQSPTLRMWFVPGEAWPEFQAVLLPDMVLAMISAALAMQLLRERASHGLIGVALGAWGYATGYSITWARTVSAPAAGPILMVGALAGFVAIWYALVSTRPSGPT